MARAVCRFWQQGTCRNGNNCRFEHPGQSQSQNSNRFGPLASGNNNNNNNRNAELPYNLSKDSLEKDLTEPERPTWILSAYGPGRDAPDQLFGGYPIEQSFEEIRLHYMQGQLAGNPQGALTEIEALYNQAQQKIQNAVSNPDAAVQYIVDAGKQHPNRIDICQQNSRPGGTTGEFAIGRQTTTNSAFGAPPGNNPFGQPSAAAPSNVFGQPAGQQANPFGAPAAPAPSAFGQPSQLGGASAFGQPSQLGGGSAFGQSSSLGAAAPSPFGQPSQLGASGFGQASALGAKPNPFGTPSAFGQPSQPTPAAQSSAFGQPSALGQKPNPFAAGAANASPFASGANAGQSPFGQPAATQNASPFGQPTATQAPAQTASPFGDAFGKPAQPSGGAFGQPQASPFGAANNAPQQNNAFGGNANPSPFGAPANNATPNAFQQPAQQASNAPGAAQGQSSGASPYAPGASRQHPSVESYTAKNPDGSLRMFKGRPVQYRVLNGEEKAAPVIQAPNGGITKIWNPDGPPPFNPDTEAEKESEYTAPVLQQWEHFANTGTFAGGMIPEVPPKREYCKWDF